VLINLGWNFWVFPSSSFYGSQRDAVKRAPVREKAKRKGTLLNLTKQKRARSRAAPRGPWNSSKYW